MGWRERRKTRKADAVDPARPVKLRLREGRVGPWLGLGLAILAVLLVLVGLGLSGRAIPLPGFVVQTVEDRVNGALGGQARLRIGRGDIVVGTNFTPQISLSAISLIAANGQRVAFLTRARAAFDPQALLNLRAEPSSFVIDGAGIALRRQDDGTFDVAPSAPDFSGQALDPAEALDALDAFFAGPGMSGLRTVTIENLDILFDDKRAEQIWHISDGRLSITQEPAEIVTELAFDLSGRASVASNMNRPDAPVPGARATANLSMRTKKQGSAARISADLRNISARDLAAQIPALAWLGALDAPLSGKIDTGFEDDGALRPLAVQLEIGKGALQPTEAVRPIAFDRAGLSLIYDPARLSLAMTDLSVDSPSLRAKAHGQAWLKDLKEGVPSSVVAQVQLTDLRADPEGVFEQAVSIGQGAMDLKLTLDPFKLTIGQMVLVDQGQKIITSGVVSAEKTAWSAAFDVSIDAISSERLLALWPVAAVPNTRIWLAENVAAGTLSDVRGALRLTPDQPPRFALGYMFRGAEVRFMKTLPPIIGGAGYATISDNAYVLVVEEGKVRAPEGGALDIAGSVLKVPDITLIPAPIEIQLESQSSLTSVLSILDQPPFKFLSKAGRAPDLATGQARLTSNLKFVPLLRIRPEDVAFDVSGTLQAVSSDKIVPGRVIAAEELSVTARNEGMTIGGSATLDGVPVKGTWHQDFGPGNRGKSRVEGAIELSRASLDTFRIGLPDGSVGGLGWGQFTLALEPDQPAAFRLTSDLQGLSLAIPEVGWSKPASDSGSFEIAGHFGTPAIIDSLSLAAPGLEAKGTLSLSDEGGLKEARFSGLKLRDWFIGDVTLTGQGPGKPIALAVTAGEADMRRIDFAAGRSGTGAAPVIDVALDRLRVSADIALDQFRGRFGFSGGMSGDFTGLINGQAPMRGTMVPAKNGRSSFRLESDDAGRALAAAGLYASGRGGTVKVVMQPRDEAATYSGTLNIRNIRVVDAPGLASLLNAVSVVGLLNELQGDGIVFSDVEARFLLTPEAVQIRKGSAVGASLGVSAEGLYRISSKSTSLQGVISPVYILNGIGQIFSRGRDGLFGFAYRYESSPAGSKATVNPLSILTPGVFRDIFRKDPPKIGE